ncbi:hypothetical protein P9Y32_25400, partial [Bacillus cereus]|nr:hypothetical protein [Bacillus cereus]MEC2460512.1 hypothetical protein [Bacillus cereus]MEC2461419.1 hypothetical protein [Bacillus cereus]MEC2536467.1 hypothetical protein [Bacillus cereus]MEC3036353.1 hypothetical protein [Bacillus cereus]
TSRFEDQAAQPASREPRAFTEKHSFRVVNPQGNAELSQMILRPLSRNILRRPSIFFITGLLLESKTKPEIGLKY